MIDMKVFIRAAKAAITSARTMEATADIDTDKEKTALGAMLNGINKSAVSRNVDTVQFNNLVEAEKSEIAMFTNDAEILSGLMSALSEVEPNINMEKVAKYNEEHPEVGEHVNAAETVKTSTDDGYVGMDSESFDVIAEALGDDAEKVFQYMSNAITSGSARRITNDTAEMMRDFEGAERIREALHEYTKSMTPNFAYTTTENDDTFANAKEALKNDVKSMTPKFAE